MAINYKWDIPQMNAHIKAEGKDNVIYTVHYRYTASEENGGKKYSNSIVGSQDFEYKTGESFVPYEDSESFETVVVGWLENALDMVAIKADLDAGIKQQITPVNEDLYFSWQDK
jgi:hypothetical protein